jgi:NADH:ubiquinone oxidoreductase subunit F (NADH-binding)
METSRTAELHSFYHLPGADLSGRACRGLACFVARDDDPARWRRASEDPVRVYCLGKCYRAPAAAVDRERPIVEVRTREAVVLRNVARGNAATLEAFRARGGYRALELALGRPAEEVVGSIEASGLRGRGGAGYPTGKKWRAVFARSADEKYVVANADEGDPGAYIDRVILEEDPHGIIEALAIAAYAVGARRGYIYLRAEYPDAGARLGAAIEEARQAGLLGSPLNGGTFSFDVRLEVGRGSYICGEETALLNALEGRRPEVRARPPYPADAGLFGRPTLVNNVETLAAVPWIVERGADAYRSLGFSSSRGTKVLSLNSLFRRPGLYEVEFGVSIRRIVEDLGGGLTSGTLKGVIVGGPLAGVIPPSLLDTPLGFDELRAIGASVGHGGVVAFDERTDIARLVHHVFDFGAYESCGKCTPCRLGARRIERIFGDILAAGRAAASDRGEWQELSQALALTSLCGHGTGLAEFAASVLRYYGPELESCFAS